MLFRSDWQPDHVDALRLLAASWYDIGAMEKAIQTLREVSRLAPADYRPVYMQASILQDFERWEDASLAFAEAAAKAPAGSPVSTEIHAAWGDCLTQLRRWEQALSVLEKAGDWPAVLALKAQAMYSLRRFDEAARLAELALAKDPTQPDAVLIAAATLERQNHAAEGLQILSNCLQKHPYDLRLHHRTADLLAALERPTEAEHYRRQAGEIAALRTRFSTAQQDALLPHVEEGLIVLVGATTENPYFSLTAPLLSRSTLFRLEPVPPEALRALVARALADAERGLGDDGLTISAAALDHLVDRAEIGRAHV